MVFGHFLENFDQKIAFFRSPSKLVNIGPANAFRQILEPITKNGYLKFIRGGNLLGRQVIESLKEKGVRTVPISPLIFCVKKNWFEKFAY